jgi:hypothetical protein
VTQALYAQRNNKTIKKRQKKWGMWFKASPGKQQDTSQPIAEHGDTCHPSYTGSINRIAVRAVPGINKHKALFKKQQSWALVAHTCNPSYPGGQDQENCYSNPAQANGL